MGKNWVTTMAGGRWLAAWYAGFALYAAGVALFSGLGQDHWWGTWAAGGYAVAAAMAVMARRSARSRPSGLSRQPSHGGRRLVAASVGVSVAGALIAPTAWLMATAQALPDVTVVARSGVLLVHHGTPYLPAAALASGGWLAYNPYLPVMALFGLPGALGVPGGTRPALIVVTFLLLYATFRVLRVPGRAALGWAAFALSCPVIAFPLTMGITDPPVIALTLLALALLARRPGPAGAREARRNLLLAAVVLGVACAMKYTAWPALAVIAVMVTTRDGARAGIRFAGTVLGTAAALVAALAPAALPHPAAIIANTVSYPLGLTTAKSPAQSPLPGHLLATLGAGGHLAALALLAVAGLAIAESLVLAPPATPDAAAIRIAIGLTALFALCPATRWGYFIYPLALVAWAWLERSRRAATEAGGERRPREDALDRGEVEPVLTSGLRARAIGQPIPGSQAPVAKAFAYLIVGLRYPLLLGWAAAVAGALLYLPPLPSAAGFADLIPSGSAAAHADADATRLFGYPLEAGIAIVQRDPRGLSPSAVDKTARAALAYDQKASIPGLAAVIPVPDGATTFPSAATAPALLTAVRQHTSTIVTFPEFAAGTTMQQQVSDAQAYADRYLTQVAGVTGPVAAQYEQGLIIDRDLVWVELSTLLAIALIVAIRFGSAVAPVAALACAGTAYVVTTRLVAWGAQRAGVSLPQDVAPVLVVLLLGVTTDYCVFFLAGMRSRLAEGAGRLQAARDSTAASAPIVFAAGLLVAGGSGALIVARSGLLRAFGPGLAVTVLVSMVVSLTLMPALLGVFGGLMFRRVAPRKPPLSASRLGRLATSRPVALLVIAGCVAGLGLAASNARDLGLGSPLIGEMPPSSGVARAYAAASAGFAPGILAPAEVLVIGPAAGSQADAGSSFEAALRRQPGVARVIGPSALPVSSPGFPNPMVAQGGQAIRFALVYDSDPLNATAIGQLRVLTARLPALGSAAGLRGVRYEVGGQTALTSDAINATASDLWRVGLAIIAVTLLLLLVYLRALLAPAYLLAASLLAVLATLGLTVSLCDAVFGSPDLVFFVPFAAGVLLVSLGSDYNVFVVGRIWAEARSLPPRDAVAIAAPRASAAITTAGMALAASFGLLALIPLVQFRQLAIMMAAGVLLDTVIVRSFLVPSLVALSGRAGMWPGRQRTRARTGSAQERLDSRSEGRRVVNPGEVASARLDDDGRVAER
jgi:RND superfamily putative drug exporter